MSLSHALAQRYAELDPTAAALSLETLQVEQSAEFLASINTESAASTLAHITPLVACDILLAMKPEAVAPLLEHLPIHLTALIFRSLPSDKVGALFEGLPEELARGIQRAMSYSSRSIGALMDSNFLVVKKDTKVSDALATVQRRKEIAHHNLYVVCDRNLLVGVVSTTELVAARSSAQIEEVMTRKVVCLKDTDSSAAAVGHYGWRDWHSLPVIDEEGMLIGVVRYNVIHAALESYSLRQSNPATSLTISLAELFWLGLSGMTEGIANVVSKPKEENGHERR